LDGVKVGLTIRPAKEAEITGNVRNPGKSWTYHLNKLASLSFFSFGLAGGQPVEGSSFN